MSQTILDGHFVGAPALNPAHEALQTEAAGRLLYPHENWDALARPESGREWWEIVRLLSPYIPEAVRTWHAPSGDKQARSFEIINGSEGAQILPRKQLFGELLGDLGYRTPRSLYVITGTAEEQIVADATCLLPGETSFFIKPVHGSQGRGTALHTNIYQAAHHVAMSGEDYLLQSNETPVEDWRYVLHRDASDPTTTWRIAYKKVRSSVVGSGETTIAQLIRASVEIPEDKKSTIIRNIKDRADFVPSRGEIVAVAASGNISNGAFGQLPEQTELTHMDQFMERFMHDLEGRLDTKFNTICLDLGVKDLCVFEGEYDFDKMRDGVVFYECQMPFGVTGYLEEVFKKGGSLTDRLKNAINRKRMLYRLGRSAMKNLITPLTP